MNNKLGDAMALIMPVLGVAITILADIDDPIIKWSLIVILIVFAVVYSIFTTLRSNKNISNTRVINKSKRYTKHLAELIKVNARVLAKDYNLTELAETKKKISEVTKKINRSFANDKQAEIEKLVQEKNLLLDKYYDNSHSYADDKLLNANAPTKKMVKLANYEESQKVFNLIYETVKDMERILLQLEQHELRIKIGKFVVKYSTDINKTIHAYVDYIGWTYVLLGDNKRGFEAIQEGLHLIDYMINNNEEGYKKYCELKNSGEEISELIKKQYEDYCKCVLQKARALRHLGTTYYTYRSFKDNFVKENYKKEGVEKKSAWNYDNTVNPYVKYKLAESLELLQAEGVKEYFNENDDRRKTYAKMVFGIKYNDLLYDYYVAVYKNIQSVETYVQIRNQLNELVEEINKANFDDDHRLIKILTLKNQLKHKIYNQQDESGVKIEGAEKWDKLLANDLNTIEKVLNKNIYFDEAMEVYVCQKVRKLYTDIEKVFDK